MTDQNNASFLTNSEHLAWRAVQVLVWLVGLTIFFSLLIRPQLGLHLFWNILIPVAPALLVFAPGVWRNVCPLGSTALVPKHLDHKPRRMMSIKTQGIFSLVGVSLLLLIVPFRHVALDTSGFATAAVLAASGLVAIGLCRVFEWKSAWCSGLCPVHPVEKLYGMRPGVTPKNAHCHECHRCVRICPDSTIGMTPLLSLGTNLHLLAGTIMAGGFVGFIWGWFQVPDYPITQGWQHLGLAYGLPLGGLVVSLTLFLLLKRHLAPEHHTRLLRVFAAAAVACYYWYRLPGLVGYGAIPGDGMLLDLTSTLPEWSVAASRVLTTLLFFWWIVVKKNGRRSWTRRPPYAREFAVQPGEGASVSLTCSVGGLAGAKG